MRSRRSLCLALSIALTSALAAACTNTADTEPGDPAADAGPPSPLGSGLRIAECNNPNSTVRPANDQSNVSITGATFIIEDTFNENGKSGSVGTVYVQDFQSNLVDGGAQPYSGIELYKSTYEPASLALAPGDVIDFVGEYEEFDGVPSFMFGGAYQPEMYEPIITFRFDYSPPVPVVIPVTDLESYETGYRWMSMLVTVKDTIGGNFTENAGAGGVYLTGETGQDSLTVDNELYAFPYNDPMYANTSSVHFISVTGVVTYFGNFHIAPRSAADVQAEPVE